jgi:hypothetical protein
VKVGAGCQEGSGLVTAALQGILFPDNSSNPSIESGYSFPYRPVATQLLGAMITGLGGGSLFCLNMMDLNANTLNIDSNPSTLTQKSRYAYFIADDYYTPHALADFDPPASPLCRLCCAYSAGSSVWHQWVSGPYILRWARRQ